MNRGEIWVGIWPGDPDKKPRPLLVVSNNLRNQASHLLDVVVVKLTSLERSDGSEKPVNTAEDFIITLRKRTIARCAAIYAVEKGILHKKIGQLSITDMREIDERIKNALDLH